MAYEREMRISGAKWDGMTDGQRLEALRGAHGKGHEAAKKWWLRYHGGEGGKE